MRDKKILHVAGCDKFIPSYIKLINRKFDQGKHEFLLLSGIADKEVDSIENVNLSQKSFFSRLKHYVSLMLKIHTADKVILHSIFDIRVILILFISPWLLGKCYWVIWGNDLYVYKLGKRNFLWKMKEYFRRPVIKNMGHLVTYIDGDVALARKWYGAKGRYHECLMYTSNLYKELIVDECEKSTINIQVGNSADPSNNHIEALEKLLPYKDENILIFVPLSYGCSSYAQQVIEQGKSWFGEKFKPLTEFMPFGEYLSFLGSVDIAIFNHKRQQAMGNTITLLGLGKRVYLRSETTQWEFFREKGIKVGSLDSLDLQSGFEPNDNIALIKKYFSQENFIKQLKRLFES